MKRFLCILLCLLLVLPAAMADSYTPTRLFRQQFITGGNGLRGTVSLTAHGSAQWLDVLLPFTATELQVRIIGEQQGAQSNLVADDDDWQVKVWAKGANDEQRGLTWIYGGPEAIYFKSEMLPGELLTLPVKGAHPAYQLTDGQMLPLLSAFDPLSLMQKGEGGNEEIWSALVELSKIPQAEWEADWAPVFDKYALLMDLWLAEFASPTVVTDDASGMTMRTTYEIPADAVKMQTKYIISLLVVDGELQNLLAPYLTDAQRSLYLNPAMIWFYDHCIDMAPLNGSVLLEREMTMRGETRSMAISLPLPTLPEEMTSALGALVANLFGMEDTNLLGGVERISVREANGDLSVSLMSADRTISLIVDDRADNAESVHWEGFVRITPAMGNDEAPLSAAFDFRSSKRIWEDEDYSTHEDLTWSLQVKPDRSLLAEDDPFGSRYVDFAPISLEASVGFTRKEKSGSPVQLAISLDAALPDAQVGLTASLKVAERWAHEELPTMDAKDLSALTQEERNALRTTLINNAVTTMTTLNAAPVQ